MTATEQPPVSPDSSGTATLADADGRGGITAAPSRSRTTRPGSALAHRVVARRAAPVATTAGRASGVWRRHALTVAYAAAGFLGVLIVVGSAPVWRNAAPSWRLTVPGLPHPPDSSLLAGALFLGGLVLMWIGWVGLVGRSERMPGSPTRRLAVVLVVLGLWVVPPMLGTPLLSNDAYSYAAQGEMATQGIDPTAVGPYALHRGPFLNAVDPVWRDAPAPYGPVAIQLQALSAEVTGHDPAGTVWMMRVLAVLGVAMTVAGVVVIARQHRVSAATAVVTAAAGPLVLLHMVGGSHNDALMMGLLTLAMAAFGAKRRVVAVIGVAAALAVKLPAAAGLGFIGWNWSGRPDTPMRTRIVSAALVTGAAAVLVAVASRVVGIGFGWVTALSATGSITSTFSVSTKLGLVASDVSSIVGLGVSGDTWVSAFRLAGLVAAVAISAWLLINSPRIGTVRALGLAMVVTVLLGPVVWPWYLPAGLVLVAATGLGRWRPTYLVLVMAASTFVWPTSVNPVQALSGVGHLVGLGFLVAIIAACLVAQRLAARSGAHVTGDIGDMGPAAVSGVATPSTAPT